MDTVCSKTVSPNLIQNMKEDVFAGIYFQLPKMKEFDVYVLLFGVGKERDDKKHAVKKTAKEI